MSNTVTGLKPNKQYRITIRPIDVTEEGVVQALRNFIRYHLMAHRLDSCPDLSNDFPNLKVPMSIYEKVKTTGWRVNDA